MLREEIAKLIENSIKTLQKEKKLPGFKIPEILIERPREKSHGDYSTNIALQIAKIAKKKPAEIANLLNSKFQVLDSRFFDRIETAGPGFINFFLSEEYLQEQVKEVLREGDKFGSLKIGRENKVNVEFISANPTGPLTLGNGRGGFCGDVLANVLEKAGYKVTREYYINDRGKQIEDLKKGLYKGEKRSPSQIQKANQRMIAEKLKIKFDVWFSEKSLYKSKEVDKVLGLLKKKKLVYEKEGALWFKSTKFGDDKDRVLVRANGERTYFASDVAYLKNKFKRGFDRLIFFWGADHYGYVARIKAAVEALGYRKEQADFIVMQLVAVMWAGEGKKELMKMSKRKGVYFGLDRLIDPKKGVGLDVTRFFFLTRSPGSHLIFDYDLAKERSEKNPVYYVQYAHARICSILRKVKNQKPKASFELLNHPSELDLIKQLIKLPEIVEDTARDYQVQRIPQYAIDLTTAFHQFYENCRVISEDKELTQTRLSLILAVKNVLKNTFDLMGISAPEKM